MRMTSQAKRKHSQKSKDGKSLADSHAYKLLLDLRLCSVRIRSNVTLVLSVTLLNLIFFCTLCMKKTITNTLIRINQYMNYGIKSSIPCKQFGDNAV